MVGVKTHNSDAYEAYLLKLKQIIMCCRRPFAPDAVVSMVSEFIFEVPNSWSPAKQNASWGRAARQQNQGDSDNLQKPLADSLQEMGWIANDAQVAAMMGVKRYQRNREELPCTILTFLATT